MTRLPICERLTKRAKNEREIAANSALVAELLQPEMAKFEARTGHNIYAVSMAVDHRNSAKRDAAFADDLEQSADTINALLDTLVYIRTLATCPDGGPATMEEIASVADRAIKGVEQ